MIDILIYLHPDDHMLDMWQKDYVLQLEKAVVRLQQDMTDYRTELKLRTQTPDSGLQTDSGG